MAKRVFEVVVPDTSPKKPIGVCCLVCDGFIPKGEVETSRPIGFLPEICDKCKAAIMAMRKQMEEAKDETEKAV